MPRVLRASLCLSSRSSPVTGSLGSSSVTVEHLAGSESPRNLAAFAGKRRTIFGHLRTRSKASRRSREYEARACEWWRSARCARPTTTLPNWTEPHRVFRRLMCLTRVLMVGCVQMWVRSISSSEISSCNRL